MSPMTALRWLLDLSDWITMPISVAIWIVTAGLIVRVMVATDVHVGAEGWGVALLFGFLAGLLWPWLLLFALPAALGLGCIWGLAALVAHPPRRTRKPLRQHEHWTDSLPGDIPLERVIELAEQRAQDPQPTRPDPAWRGWQ